MARPPAVIVMAAGRGTRTKVETPKVLLPLCGRSLLECVLDAVDALEPERIVVVVSYGKDEVIGSMKDRPGLTFVDQGDPKGTGHAVQQGMTALADFDGEIMVINGDGALITGETLCALRDDRGDAAMSLLTAVPVDPEGLGRVLRDDDDMVLAVREQKDCSDAELGVDEINAGFYSFDSKTLPGALAGLSSDNAQGEYYITDTVEYFLNAGESVAAVQTEDAEEVAAINSLVELAIARQIMQERILEQHLLAGVIIDDPNTTYIDHGVEIGAGTRILPCCVIHAGVTIGAKCEVGPFTQLRVGTVMEDQAAVGNFVEVKKSRIGRGSKAKHLTYLGDTTIGAKANIGAGTITANYDGTNKYPTVIADGAFIGSGTVLVAPCNVGIKATTGAGAVVTRNTQIGDDEVYVGVPAKRLAKPAKTETT